MYFIKMTIFAALLVLLNVNNLSFAGQIDIDITRNLHYFEDESNKLAVDEIYKKIKSPSYKIKKNTLNKSYVYHNQWIYIKVKSPNNILSNLILELDVPYSGFITPYLLKSGEWKELDMIGSSVYFQEESFKSLRPSITSNYLPGEVKEYLFLRQSTHLLSLKIKLKDEHTFHKKQSKIFTTSICYLGIILSILIANISLIFFKLSKSIIFNCLLTFVLLILVLIENGVINYFNIGIIYPLTHFSAFLTASLCIITLLFLSSFLEIKEKSPKLYRFNIYVTCTLGSFFIFLLLPFEKILFIKRGYFLYSILIPSIVVSLISCAYGLYKKNIRAYFFFISILSFCLPSFKWILTQHFNIFIPFSYSTMFLLGSFISSIMLTCAIFYKILSQEKSFIINSITASSKARYIQELNELIFNISTPLMSIKNLANKLNRENNLSRQPYLDKIINAERNMTLILQNARAVNSKITLRIESISNLIKTSLIQVESKLKRKSISVKLELQENLKLNIDATKIVNSAFNNILTNSIKFSDEGSSLFITSYKINDMAYIEFCDYGKGIPTDIQSTLFNKNNHNTRTGTMGEGGTGFGMGLIKESVESFHGSIKVISPISEKQSGTKVILVFPSVEIKK